jgi:hypothetical protein
MMQRRKYRPCALIHHDQSILKHFFPDIYLRWERRETLSASLKFPSYSHYLFLSATSQRYKISACGKNTGEKELKRKAFRIFSSAAFFLVFFFFMMKEKK